jgi:hypothetical protein
MAIENWMGALKTLMQSVSGMGAVRTYVDLPGSLADYPVMIIMPVSGSQRYSPGIGIHRVEMALYFTNQILPEAYSRAVPFIKLVRDKLASDITLGGLVQYCQPPVPPANFYEGPGAIGYVYSQTEHVGIKFFLDVKDLETIAVS